MLFLVNCFRNLRMKQQIIIVDTIIMSFILMVIIGTYFVQQTILFHFIQSSSEAITMKKEKRQLELTSLKISSFLEQKYDRSILNILNIDEFFQYTLENQDRYKVSNELFQQCVPKELIEKEKIIFNSNLFCYQIFHGLEDISSFNQSSSLLSQFSLLFDVTAETRIIIGSFPDPQIIVSYPLMYSIADYNVTTRPWFIAYQNMYEAHPDEQYYYTPVYQSVFSQEQVRAVIATITDKQGSPIGYSRNTILLRDEQLSKVPMNILLVNNDGGIVFSSVIPSTQQNYIYNQSITGFNNSDWEDIQYYTDNDKSDQLCNGYANTFCLFNKLFNTSVQIDAHHFKKEQFSLIIFTNVTFEAELAQEFNNLTSNLTEQFVQIEWILIIVCIALIIMTAIFVHFIFVPLFQLMENIKRYIRSMGNNLNKEIFKMITTQKKPVNVFSNLNVRFMTLHDLLSKNQSQKSRLCLEIEQILYNQKAPDLDYCNIRENVEKIDGSPFRKEKNMFLSKRRSNRQVNICAFELIKNTLQEQYCNNHQKD